MGCAVSIPVSGMPERAGARPRRARQRPMTKAERLAYEERRREARLKEDADRHFFNATFHYHHGGWEETARLCTLAKELWKEHKRAVMLRCEARIKLKQWDGAMEDADACIAMGHREGHRVRGATHLAKGSPRDAVADLNIALRIEPSDRKAWRLRSKAHAQLGNTKRAAEDATEAERKDEDAEAGLCVVCIDAPRATRLNPCEHNALCPECARECQRHHGVCPICNAQIKAIEYGQFMGTFAPVGDDVLNKDRLASAIKKAREESVMCATLNPIGESGSPRMGGEGDGSPSSDGEIRPVTPDNGMGGVDYAAFEVGGDMSDEDALLDEGMSESEPGTPDLNIAGFGHTQEIASPTPLGDRAQQILAYDSEEETPAGEIDDDGEIEPGTP